MIKTNTGHHMSLVATAATLSKVGLEERRDQCISLSSVPGYLTDHLCMLDPTKLRKEKNALPIEYPNILLSIAPVRYNTTDLIVPQPTNLVLQKNKLG